MSFIFGRDSHTFATENPKSMAIDTTQLTNLITAFRQLNEQDSITPENLGALLQSIADHVARSAEQTVVDNILNSVGYLSQGGLALTGVAQGKSDRNHIYANFAAVNLKTGQVGLTQDVQFIQQATTDRAGAMRAQQVTDLNEAKRNASNAVNYLGSLATIGRVLQSLAQGSDDPQNVLMDAVRVKLNTPELEEVNDVVFIKPATETRAGAMTAQQVKDLAEAKAGSQTKRISCYVKGSKLYVHGAETYIANGYVPYIFRFVRKRNRIKITGARTQYADAKKGWSIFGCYKACKIGSGNLVNFTMAPHAKICCPDKCEEAGYSHDATYFVEPHLNKKGTTTQIGWGTSTVVTHCKTDETMTKRRLLRMPFGIAFGPPMIDKISTIRPSQMVSNLAQFSIIYQPSTQAWLFGK